MLPVPLVPLLLHDVYPVFYPAQPFLPHNDDANESHNEGGRNSEARPTRGRPPSRPGRSLPCLLFLSRPFLMPFLPPAPCLASPFLSTDVAKRADGTRSRGRKAVFFRSLAFLSWGRRCNSNRAAGNRQGANDGATRTAANRHARHVRRFLGRERGNYHEQERQGGIRRPRAQVQQSNREPTTAVSHVPPPPHVRILANFIRLLPLASYCADETERRASAAPKATEIHKTRNPRPFTGPFFGPYMHPNRPLDLKIVFNQHPKPPNGITNVFRFSAHSWVVNFLFLFR